MLAATLKADVPPTYSGVVWLRSGNWCQGSFSLLLKTMFASQQSELRDYNRYQAT